jgi:hypothetical protein
MFILHNKSFYLTQRSAVYNVTALTTLLKTSMARCALQQAIPMAAAARLAARSKFSFHQR